MLQGSRMIPTDEPEASLVPLHQDTLSEDEDVKTHVGWTRCNVKPFVWSVADSPV